MMELQIPLVNMKSILICKIHWCWRRWNLLQNFYVKVAYLWLKYSEVESICRYCMYWNSFSRALTWQSLIRLVGRQRKSSRSAKVFRDNLTRWTLPCLIQTLSCKTRKSRRPTRRRCARDPWRDSQKTYHIQLDIVLAIQGTSIDPT